MSKFKTLFLFSFVIFLFGSFTPATEQVKWMSLEEARINLQKEKKPILIDLYTDWCGWCKVMDKKTYSNKNVALYLQDKFYAVRINAETRSQIKWNEKVYNYNSGYKANEFAVYLTNGRLAFPTTVIIPADGGEPQAIPGYLETKDFELIAKYFGEGNYNKIPFEDYQKNFKPSW